MKNKIKKYIRKYIAFACSLLLIPIFSVNAFAYTSSAVPFAVEIHNYDEDSYIYYGSSSVQIDSSLSTTPTVIFDCVLDNSFLMACDSGFLNLNFVIHQSIVGLVNLRCDFYSSNNTLMGTVYRGRTMEQAQWNSHTINITSDVVSDVDYENSKDISRVRVTCTWPTGSTYSETICMTIGAVGFASDGTMTSVVGAINNQTSQLSSLLQYGGELIENGNEDTQSAVSDFNEVFEDFNAELENIEEFDSQIIGEFESANEQYLTELNNFSLSASLLNAGNWLSTSMQTVYDNSSDYKMLWLVPLLLGIPLIILFLKRSDDNE